MKQVLEVFAKKRFRLKLSVGLYSGSIQGQPE
jgi:hypothetical protein